jgi:hypothetical protein
MLQKVDTGTQFDIEQDPDPVFTKVRSGSGSKSSGSATLLVGFIIFFFHFYDVQNVGTGNYQSAF